MLVSGVFMQCDTPNGNGHVYSGEQVKRVIEEYQEKLKSGEKIFGELSPNYEYASIHLNNISHTVNDICYNEDSHTVEGELSLLDTPRGKICQEIINALGELEVAPRVIMNGDKLESIISFDIVQKSAFENAKVRKQE